MIKLRVLRQGREVEELDVEQLDVEELAAVRREPSTLIWVDVASPTPAELATVGGAFGIHEVALEDIQVDQRQRPKVERYPGQVLLVFYGAQAGTGERPTRLWELDLIAGDNYLLSFHGRGPIDPEPVIRRVNARPELASDGAGYLLYEDYQQLIGGALETNATIASNRVNTVARNLAAYAAIFAVVTMISGVYGMNFAHMPELGWRLGYAWALGLMVACAGGLWVYFKRKGWL